MGATPSDAFEASAAALATWATDPRVRIAAVRERLAAVTEDQLVRGASIARLAAQQERLGLPPLPTTTIGSYPQTSAIRTAARCAAHRDRHGRVHPPDAGREVDAVIALQGELGLDVLVHGEPERNDMVQYFAEQLDGFFATRNGWVQSYGTRCVPPILFGDASCGRRPMTVDWTTYAIEDRQAGQGMLTGPCHHPRLVVRPRRPAGEGTRPTRSAPAIRDETIDLEKAGTGIIQVDEPALRELPALRDVDKTEYLRWAVDAFRFGDGGVADTTQVHTHLCYPSSARSSVHRRAGCRRHVDRGRPLGDGDTDDLNAIGFRNGVGPGVYDIHSPRVPSTDEIT